MGAISVGGLVLLALAHGCGADTATGPDRDTDPDRVGDAQVDAEADRDRDSDRDADADGVPRAGPMTFISARFTVSEERVCDFDGDGVGDNAVADLGSPASSISAGAIGAFVEGRIRSGSIKMIFHFPWVTDLAGPNDPGTKVLLFNGVDVDDPDDPTDNHSGSEEFYCPPNSLDPCGEPRYPADAAIERGVLEVSGVRLLLPGIDLPLEHALGTGTVEPGGTAMSLQVCGYAPTRDIGGLAMVEEAGELSLLEILLAGGAAVGIPGVPGLTPDVDVDGDGLERYVVDGTGRVEACVDGDSTEFMGRDCWDRDQMADGISMVAELEGVPARYAGRQPGWEARYPEGCADPPEHSLWDPP
jgi:hypothetical protein